MGRPKNSSIFDNNKVKIIELLKLGIPPSKIAKIYDRKPTTFYAWCRKNKINVKTIK